LQTACGYLAIPSAGLLAHPYVQVERNRQDELDLRRL
jgi:hypothetical protein